MTALLRLVGPAVAKYFAPGPDDLIDAVFDGTPMPVTAEVYPCRPATRITGQTLSVNGVARDFTSVSGQSPTWLQFRLGGDAGETAGGINTMTVSVSDDTGATTHFVLRYFRLAAAGAGGTPTISPGTTRKGTHPPAPKPGKPPGAGATPAPAPTTTSSSSSTSTTTSTTTTTTTTSTISPMTTKKPPGKKPTQSGKGPKRQGAPRQARKGRGSRA